MTGPTLPATAGLLELSERVAVALRVSAVQFRAAGDAGRANLCTAGLGALRLLAYALQGALLEDAVDRSELERRITREGATDV